MVYADTTEDLVNALVTKGVLTEEEGALLSKGHDKKKANTPIVKNKDGKFSLESADGRNEIALTGRMHFDYRATDLDENDVGNSSADDDATGYDVDGKSLGDQFEMRRARIGIKGKLDGAWKYDVVLNGVGKSTNVLDTASLTWAAMKPFQIQVGRFKQAFNLEGLTSSNDIDTLERSWINQISPHKKLGIAFKGEPTKGMTYAFTKYQEAFSDNDIENENNYSGRVTYDWASANKIKDSIFHVGLSGFTEDYSVTPKTSSNGIDPKGCTVDAVNGDACMGTTHSKLFNFKSAGRGYSPLASLQIEGQGLTNGGASQKGKMNNRHEMNMFGLEGIFAKGPFKLQAEYAKGDAEGTNEVNGNSAEADIELAYLTAGWILTGEHYSKSYKGGKMKGLKPNNPFDFEKGTGTGLWEVIGRYEYMDIDNIDITQNAQTSTNGSSGSNTRLRGAADCGTVDSDYTSANGCKVGAQQWTIGLKWVANPNVLAKISYTYSDYDDDLKPADISNADTFDSEQLIQTRVQWMF
jgi:phosphate-selective porin OprO/OprP